MVAAAAAIAAGASCNVLVVGDDGGLDSFVSLSTIIA